MGKPLSQETCDRIKRLLQVHPRDTVADIVGVNRSTITTLRKRGFLAAYQPSDRRPRPSDFAILCESMTINELRIHYRASDNTVRRWARDIGRKKMTGGGIIARPIPDDLAEILEAKGIHGAAAHYGVHYNTVGRWRKAKGLPFSWSRQPKGKAKASTMAGWADRYFSEQRAV